MASLTFLIWRLYLYNNTDMKTAFISDIHSNLEALQAVLADCEKNKVERIICLGDLIDYGPNPREVVKEIMKVCKTVLRGNHEEAVLWQAIDFHDDAARSVEWTREALNDESKPKEENHQIWNYIGDLPDSYEEDGGDILLIHASPRDHIREYVRPFDVQDKMKMREIFSLIKRLAFCGHTHEPGVFTDDFRFYSPAGLNYKVKLTGGRRFYVNIGSVGQPRDRDPRACYVIWDNDIVEFRRVEYDIKKTMEKILQTKMIPKRYAERLPLGR